MTWADPGPNAKVKTLTCLTRLCNQIMQVNVRGSPSPAVLGFQMVSESNGSL